MASCVHHVPGRLRVRVPWLGAAEDGGVKLQAELSALEGVQRVQLNPHAGSITVVYDPGRLEVRTILMRIPGGRSGGGGSRPTVPPGVAASATRIGGLFGRALFDAVLARGVERSVRFLVGGR